MTDIQRVETLEDLKAWLIDLFGAEISPTEPNHYQVMFTVDGKVKKVMAALQEKTGEDGWAGEASYWYYGNNSLNLNMCLSSAPGCVLVIASVASLHYEALKPFVAG